MLFDEDFILKLNESPKEGIARACRLVNNQIFDFEDEDGEWSEEEHQILWEGASFIYYAARSHGVELGLPFDLESTGDIGKDCVFLKEYVDDVLYVLESQSVKLKAEQYTSYYKTAFGASFVYEFSQGDLERIQALLNEIRDEISLSTLLTDEHKQRILQRLERVQTELHKKVSDLDRLWGLLGDAGVVLGKLGEDAKPIVDRFREVAEIVWKTQARAEELPSASSNPMLEHTKDAYEDE